jgi:4,5-dihydroxyphthalate decarboxylase
MADLHLSFAMTAYDRMLPLINGEVKPDGITLEYQGMPGQVPGVFYDQLKFQRYDVSEMSMSSFLLERARGFPYRLLPVFHNRQFSYTNLIIRRSSGIRVDHPEDLKGKRIAIGDYQQTIGLWTRGILLHEFGVKPDDMVWYQTRGEHYSHTGASGTKPPVELHFADAEIGTLFTRGEIDVAFGWGGGGGAGAGGHALARADVDIRGNPEFTPLFSDQKGEAARYYKKTGIYPPHHTTAVRESILTEHPWVARSLMEAFEESKKIAMTRLRHQTLYVFMENYQDEIKALMGNDPFAYGLAANRKAIEMAQQISHEQSLTPKVQPIEDLFAEEIFIMEERL